MQKKKRVVLTKDTYYWVFPIAFHLKLCGNNHRPYCLQILFLCYQLTFGIDADCYYLEYLEDE